MSVIIGIDPGQRGAICALRDDGHIEFCDIEGSLSDAIYFLRRYSHDAFMAGGAVIEKVSSFPGQGVSSSFNFGSTYGHLRGAVIALGIAIIAEPTPVVWRRAIFGQKKKQDKKTLKRMCRDKARELFPQAADRLSRVKDSDRSEALLLVFYGRLKVGEG